MVCSMGCVPVSFAYPAAQIAHCVSDGGETCAKDSYADHGATPGAAPTSSGSPGAFGMDAEFVDMDTTVPESTGATLALFGLALILLGIGRRKRTVHIQRR